ncbi:hypothetical protein GCM10009675_24870 [Prauserella alba]|uniref:Uncharacterized protein n=1 Tax=Prauserella alba TaxID=176898 RepID=A0ABN1VEI5_9PSEU
MRADRRLPGDSGVLPVPRSHNATTDHVLIPTSHSALHREVLDWRNTSAVVADGAAGKLRLGSRGLQGLKVQNSHANHLSSVFDKFPAPCGRIYRRTFQQLLLTVLPGSCASAAEVSRA